MPGLPNSSGISEEQLQSLRQAFALFDKDDSGSIDASELKACLRAMGHYPTPMELEDLMRRMDTDGNGEIDFDEFVKAMVHKFEVGTRI